MGDGPGRHRTPDDHPSEDPIHSTEIGRPDDVTADEGEPDVEAFAGDEQVLRPNAPKDGEHGYGYE